MPLIVCYLRCLINIYEVRNTSNVKKSNLLVKLLQTIKHPVVNTNILIKIKIKGIP